MTKTLLKLRKVIYFWAPPLLWSIIIFTFSSQTLAPASPVKWQDFLIHKTAHVVEYSFFVILIYRALKNYGVKSKKAALLSVIVCLLYGATDEFHQSFTPGREPRVRDILIDSTGAAITMWLVYKYLPKAPESVRKIAGSFNL